MQFKSALSAHTIVAAAAAAAAAALPAAASPELMQQGWEIKSPWFQRDVPLSYDILLENMTDPAHVPQSHHGVVVSVLPHTQQCLLRRFREVNYEKRRLVGILRF